MPKLSSPKKIPQVATDDRDENDLLVFEAESTQTKTAGVADENPLALLKSSRPIPGIDSTKASGTSLPNGPQGDPHRVWNILVVDDDPSVFEVTKLALSNYEFRGKGLHLLRATNEAEAIALLHEDRPIALVILDVVMEHPDSGLRLVKYIRNHLGNNKIQIILRTGQPGDQPEEVIVQIYAINDYKLKTELTRDKLFTCVTLALRTYEQSHDVLDLANRLMVTNTKLIALNSSLETQVSERTDQLKHKSHELSEAYIDICNLLRIMTHDQNNYLAITLANAEIIPKISDSSQIQKRAENIQWAVKAQRDLIQKISRFDALKSGKSSYELSAINLADALAKTMTTFEAQLLDKHITLEIDNQCPPDTKVMVDQTIFVSSILNNLISNGIKFSQKGSKIKMTCLPYGNNQVKLKVKDHGIGIPPELLAGLFSFNVRTTRLGTSGEKGTGFGMPIVKSLVEKMKGTIEVQSSEKTDEDSDHGTTFTITVQKAAS